MERVQGYTTWVGFFCVVVVGSGVHVVLGSDVLVEFLKVAAQLGCAVVS